MLLNFIISMHIRKFYSSYTIQFAQRNCKTLVIAGQQQPSTQILTTVKSFLEIIPAFTVRTAFGTNKLLHYSNV